MCGPGGRTITTHRSLAALAEGIARAGAGGARRFHTHKACDGVPAWLQSTLRHSLARFARFGDADGELCPRVRATLQRAHTSDPFRFQEQRRTGAGGFIWSTAKENDLPVTWNFLAARGEFFEGDADGAWDQIGILR